MKDKKQEIFAAFISVVIFVFATSAALKSMDHIEAILVSIIFTILSILSFCSFWVILFGGYRKIVIPIINKFFN